MEIGIDSFFLGFVLKSEIGSKKAGENIVSNFALQAQATPQKPRVDSKKP